MAEIVGLGHVGIYAHDLMKQRDFWTRVMGLKIADEDLEGCGMVFLSSHPAEEHHEFVLMAGRDVPQGGKLVQQISFKVASIDDLKSFHSRLVGEGVQVEQIVSHGNALGLYFFDPEGNRVELYYKTGLSVPQPRIEPIDIQASEEELMAIARAALPSD